MKVHDHVGWQWGQGIATGTIESIHPEHHTITTKGKQITRNGTKDDPAIVIKQENGTKVLKLQHELQVVD
jgi:hypothetical protein